MPLAAAALRFGGGAFDGRVPVCHQSDLGGSVAPIARASSRRRRVWFSLAVIAIWIAVEIAPGRSGCQREPAAGTVLDDDYGGPIREDDAGLLDSGIVGHRDLHIAPCWVGVGSICNLVAKPNLILNPYFSKTRRAKSRG